MARSDEEFLQIARDAFQRDREATGVCSFASSPRNMLMWSHYAFKHTGVCFQFDVARDPDIFALAIPVEYSDEYPRVDWVCGAKEGIEKILFTKETQWKYENEKRFIK